MEIYQQPGSQPSSEPQSQRRQFPESNLNFRLPIWEKIVFFLLGSIGFDLIGSLFYYPFKLAVDGKAMSANLANSLIMFLSYFALVACFLLFFFCDHRKTYATFGAQFKDRKVFAYGLLGFIAVLFVQYFFGFLYQATVPTIYGINDNQTAVETQTTAYPGLLFFPLVLFAPFTEELTYRIGLVDTIGHKDKHRWLGIVFSALIFGLIHFGFSEVLTYQEDVSALQAGVEGMTQAIVDKQGLVVINELLNLPIYVLSGFVFAFLYAKTGKISSSMMAHCYNNLYSFILIIIAPMITSSSSSSSTAVSTIASLWLH
jgi:membrane protease YdiL (CAAX protease family)